MKVVCAHCGLPFQVARVAPGRAPYCCSGCALAARLTAAPASTGAATTEGPPPRVVAVAAGLAFGGVNQALAWLLAALLSRENPDSAIAPFLAPVSLLLGIAVWLGLAAAQWGLGARRWVDFFAYLSSGSALILGAIRGEPGYAFAANAVLAGWALRGALRARASR